MAAPQSYGSFNQPRAYQGYQGYLDIGGYIVRAESVNFQLKQEISRPDVIDGRFDKSVYHPGPLLAEGDFSFLGTFDVGSSGSDGLTLVHQLYKNAIYRLNTGSLEFEIPTIQVVHAFENAAFEYTQNYVDSFNFSISEGDALKIKSNIMAHGRNDASAGFVESGDRADNTRAIVWSDCYVSATSSNGEEIKSEYIKSFEFNCANALERYYTLNGTLQPQSIMPKKRELTGKIQTMGRNSLFSADSQTITERCEETGKLTFGFKENGASGCGGNFDITLDTGVVYQIEELSLSNEIFTADINYFIMPAGGVSSADPMRLT